ncbi:MAG: 50S ribosomal protein L5 [Gammaproteobacteria bacterium]
MAKTNASTKTASKTAKPATNAKAAVSNSAENPLKSFYKQTVVPALMQKFGYSNVMQVPAIKAIVLNMGVGEAVNDRKIVDQASKELTSIAGQKSVITKSRKSVAGFKIREGWPIGCKATLRGTRMYEFLERLLYIAIPRIRDFRGLNKRSFDAFGNFSMGVKEQIIFPEIQYDQVDAVRGLDISIVTTAKNKEEGLALLLAMTFPFKE